MHALFWPELFMIGGGVSEHFAEFAPLLRSPAALRRRDFAGAGGRGRRGAGRGRVAAL